MTVLRAVLNSIVRGELSLPKRDPNIILARRLGVSPVEVITASEIIGEKLEDVRSKYRLTHKQFDALIEALSELVSLGSRNAKISNKKFRDCIRTLQKNLKVSQNKAFDIIGDLVSAAEVSKGELREKTRSIVKNIFKSTPIKRNYVAPRKLNDSEKREVRKTLLAELGKDYEAASLELTHRFNISLHQVLSVGAHFKIKANKLLSNAANATTSINASQEMGLILCAQAMTEHNTTLLNERLLELSSSTGVAKDKLEALTREFVEHFFQ